VTTLGCTLAGPLSTTLLDPLTLISSLVEARLSSQKLVVAYTTTMVAQGDS
jgi:hypothetical protein